MTTRPTARIFFTKLADESDVWVMEPQTIAPRARPAWNVEEAVMLDGGCDNRRNSLPCATIRKIYSRTSADTDVALQPP